MFWLRQLQYPQYVAHVLQLHYPQQTRLLSCATTTDLRRLGRTCHSQALHFFMLPTVPVWSRLCPNTLNQAHACVCVCVCVCVCARACVRAGVRACVHVHAGVGTHTGMQISVLTQLHVVAASGGRPGPLPSTGAHLSAEREAHEDAQHGQQRGRSGADGVVRWEAADQCCGSAHEHQGGDERYLKTLGWGVVCDWGLHVARGERACKGL